MKNNLVKKKKKPSSVERAGPSKHQTSVDGKLMLSDYRNTDSLSPHLNLGEKKKKECFENQTQIHSGRAFSFTC